MTARRKFKHWSRHYRIWTVYGQWLRWETLVLLHEDYLLHVIECKTDKVA